jgi:hypothetical protein
MFIAVLNNARKINDLGAFINYYPLTNRRTQLHLGVMLKYMAFKYSSLHEDTLVSGGTKSLHASYKPAEGYQLATLISLGTHTTMDNNFFIRTIFALGAFPLSGQYKQQFNLMFAKLANEGTPLNLGSLPKAYCGINIGLRF